MPLTLEQIAEILSAGAHRRFVGEIENDHFDAKDQGYDISKDAGKQELAKDACAFANTVGGYILIGLRTKPSPLHFGDEVETVRLVPRDLLNPAQYEDVLDSWCYPRIPNLTVTFHPSNDDADRGIIAVSIPPQPETLKPFLVARTLTGSRHVETLFGYVERKRDANVSLDVRDLHRAVRAGLNYEQNLALRLDRIEEIIQQRQPPTHPADTEITLDLENRIRRALGEEGRG